jgi:hypothetical protein
MVYQYQYQGISIKCTKVPALMVCLANQMSATTYQTVRSTAKAHIYEDNLVQDL